MKEQINYYNYLQHKISKLITTRCLEFKNTNIYNLYSDKTTIENDFGIITIIKKHDGVEVIMCFILNSKVQTKKFFIPKDDTSIFDNKDISKINHYLDLFINL